MVLGTVRGLVSEADKVDTAYESFQPDAIAISVSEEGLLAMDEYLNSLKHDENTPTQKDGASSPIIIEDQQTDDEDDHHGETELSNMEEEHYVKHLGQWGEVKKPPPCYVRAWELAKASGLPIHAIDFNDVEYTDIYCHHINGVEWLKQASGQRSLARKKFMAKTPEEFVVEWDGFINRTRGLRAIENSRVRKMASEINELSKSCDRVLVIIELERRDEVISELEASGCRLA